MSQVLLLWVFGKVNSRYIEIPISRNHDFEKFRHREKFWYLEIPIYRNSDVEKFRYIEISIYRNSDIEKFQYREIQIQRNSDIEKFRFPLIILRKPEFLDTARRRCRKPYYYVLWSSQCDITPTLHVTLRRCLFTATRLCSPPVTVYTENNDTRLAGCKLVNDYLWKTYGSKATAPLNYRIAMHPYVMPSTLTMAMLCRQSFYFTFMWNVSTLWEVSDIKIITFGISRLVFYKLPFWCWPGPSPQMGLLRAPSRKAEKVRNMSSWQSHYAINITHQFNCMLLKQCSYCQWYDISDLVYFTVPSRFMHRQ